MISDLVKYSVTRSIVRSFYDSLGVWRVVNGVTGRCGQQTIDCPKLSTLIAAVCLLHGVIITTSCWSCSTSKHRQCMQNHGTVILITGILIEAPVFLTRVSMEFCRQAEEPKQLDDEARRFHLGRQHQHSAVICSGALLFSSRVLYPSLVTLCPHKSGRCTVELYHVSHLWYPPFYTSPMASSALQHSSSSFIFVYKRLSYATNDRNMLRSNKEKCPLIWRTIYINTNVCRAAE